MEPHHLPQHTWQLQTSNDGYVQQHIPWWRDLNADSLTELQLAPLERLQNRRVDVVVIGGGVAGLSAALSAQAAGAQTLLLEATSGLGRGATGRNAGILSAGVNLSVANLDVHGPEARFWPETTRLLLDLVTEAQRPDTLLQAHLTGALSLAENTHAVRALAHEVKARTALGTRAEMWTARQVSLSTEGRLNTSQLTGAMWLPDEGRVQPLTLLAHLARKARAAGAELIGEALVTTYNEQTTRQGTPGWQLTLENGATIEAEALIRAVGPTSQPNARIYALSFATDLPETFPLFWDASPYLYADYRAGHGRLTVSGGRYGKVGGSKHAANYYRRLSEGAHHWLPGLGTQEPVYQWGVDLAITADMVPGLHELGEQAAGLTIEGLGALGVLPGILLGQQAGKLITHSLDSDLPFSRVGASA